MSATALLERLIIQGVDTIDHPGIVSRVPTGDRRAALATGPDRWEIVRGCVSSSAATFSGAAAWTCGEEFGHDVLQVGDVGLAGAADVEVAAVARSDQRALVTENVADFAAEQDLLVVCVLKRNQLSGAGQARAVAVLLDRSPSGRAVDPLRTRIPRRALTDSCSCEPKPSGAREPNPGSSLDHITGWWSPRAASRLDTSDDGRYGGLDWFDHRDNG